MMIIQVQGALEIYLNFLKNISNKEDDVLIFIIEIFEFAGQQMPEVGFTFKLIIFQQDKHETFIVFLKIVRQYCSNIKFIKAIEKKYLQNKDSEYKKLELEYP